MLTFSQFVRKSVEVWQRFPPWLLTLTPLAGPFDVFIRLRIFGKCFLCCFYPNVIQDEFAGTGL